MSIPTIKEHWSNDTRAYFPKRVSLGPLHNLEQATLLQVKDGVVPGGRTRGLDNGRSK